MRKSHLPKRCVARVNGGGMGGMSRKKPSISPARALHSTYLHLLGHPFPPSGYQPTYVPFYLPGLDGCYLGTSDLPAHFKEPRRIQALGTRVHHAISKGTNSQVGRSVAPSPSHGTPTKLRTCFTYLAMWTATAAVAGRYLSSPVCIRSIYVGR